MKGTIAATAAVVLALIAGVQIGKWSRANTSPHVRGERNALLAAQTRTGSISPVATPSTPDPAYVTVEAATVTPSLKAYGQVQPVFSLPVNAAEKGVVTGLSVFPGAHVHAGQELAHLSGPSIQSTLQQSEADVRSAQAQLSAAEKTLAIERQQLPAHLSTRATVQQAEGAVARAEANSENAQTHLQAMRQMMTISAPARGSVLAVNASDGELVSAGQPVVTLQPAAGLWLEASYYGADLSLIRTGTTGLFSPANGSAAIPVRVQAIAGAMSPSEGIAIGLTRVDSTQPWISGEFGTVTLNLPAQKLVAVPTRALILDRGQWFVLVHTSHGDIPQRVIPGPARGWNTFLKSGLSAGSQIVVEDAYLQFHRGISRSYQAPDQ